MRSMLAVLISLVVTLFLASSAQAASVIRCSTGPASISPPRVIEGAVEQPGRFSTSVEDDARRLVGNGLPVRTRTGAWPLLTRLRIDVTVPSRPTALARPGCVSQQPIGIAVNGVLIYPSSVRSGADATRSGERDRCGGSRVDGRYAYRGTMPCLADGLVGYARDGFPIWKADGVRSRSLDRCHGRVDTRNGRRAYRYYLSATPPYTLSCFRGRPASWRITDLPSEQTPTPTTPPVAPTPVEPPPVEPTPPTRRFAVEIEELRPAFSTERTEYVLDCTDPVSVSVVDPPSPTTLDDGEVHTESFSEQVQLVPGQALRLAVGSTKYTARCLPADFPTWSFTRTAPASYPHYLFSPSLGSSSRYQIVVDDDGVPIWWARTSTPTLDAKPIGEDVIWSTYAGGGFGTSPSNAYERFTLAGELVTSWRTVGTPTDHHDFQPLPNGNALLLSYRPRDGVDLRAYGGPVDATVLDAVVQEVTPNGGLVWEWDSKDHLDLAETGRWYGMNISSALPDGRVAYDIIHINAVDPVTGGILISARHADAIYRIDRATGAIVWKVGGTDRPERLDVPGEPVPLGGQHDVRELSDGTVTVHDNRTGYGQSPRALRLRIDDVARTATVLERITDPLVTGSGCCGSARRAADGNWLMSWGGNPYVDELTADGAPVFSLRFDQGFSYRAVGVPASTWTTEELLAGMDARAPR